MKRVGIYVRVSTSDQSCEIQKNELLRFVEARGWKIVETYEDTATGTTSNRPMLKKMIQDVRTRRIDIVCCWKMDRLFRSLKDLLNTLQEFSELGVEFISLRDQIDMTTASGRLLIHLLAAFAEFEAALIRERVCAGLQNARAKGKRLGRPLSVDSKQIVELRRQGMTYRAISQKLKVSHGSVAAVLAIENRSLNMPSLR